MNRGDERSEADGVSEARSPEARAEAPAVSRTPDARSAAMR